VIEWVGDLWAIWKANFCLNILSMVVSFLVFLMLWPYSMYYLWFHFEINNQILQMSSAIFCGGSTKFMVTLSLPLQPSFNIKPKKNKRLVLDYLGLKGRRNVIIKASSDVASPSIWDNWKPPKSSSTHSFSDILWPSAGSFFLSFIYYYSHLFGRWI